MEKEREKQRARRRRRDQFRMRRKAVRIGKISMDHWDTIWQSADHLAKCSCWMCGNPRKYLKGRDRLSIQEQSFMAHEQESLRELS